MIRNIRPIRIMIYFDWFIVIFHYHLKFVQNIIVTFLSISKNNSIKNEDNKQFIAIFNRLIQVYGNNIVFSLKIRLCLYKFAINYLLSPFFMLSFISKRHFFYFFCFPDITMYVNPKFCQRYKKDTSQWDQRLYL